MSTFIEKNFHNKSYEKKLREGAKNTPRGGGAHKMGGGQMISPKNGGSVDAIVNFWGECNSNVIFMGGAGASEGGGLGGLKPLPGG